LPAASGHGQQTAAAHKAPQARAVPGPGGSPRGNSHAGSKPSQSQPTSAASPPPPKKESTAPAEPAPPPPEPQATGGGSSGGGKSQGGGTSEP
jgi:hypothetical protein